MDLICLTFFPVRGGVSGLSGGDSGGMSIRGFVYFPLSIQFLSVITHTLIHIPHIQIVPCDEFLMLNHTHFFVSYN